MFASWLLVWCAVAAFGASAPMLARRVPPRSALALLVGGGLLAAGAALGSLLVVVAPAVGQLPVAAAIGRWSVTQLAVSDPYSHIVTGVAAAALAVLAVRVARRGSRAVRVLRSTWRLADTCGDAGDLLVLEDAGSVAYALPARPGRRGRTVVSRDLLRLLDGRGRQALLAHEREHLRRRHDLVGLCATLVAAANPLLGSIPTAVELASERQADRAAVRAVGSPRVVAATIALAAGVPAPAGFLAAAGADVPLRVADLLRPAAPRTAVLAALPLLGLLAVAAASALWLAHDVDHLFDVARLVLHR